MIESGLATHFIKENLLEEMEAELVSISTDNPKNRSNNHNYFHHTVSQILKKYHIESYNSVMTDNGTLSVNENEKENELLSSNQQRSKIKSSSVLLKYRSIIRLLLLLSLLFAKG